MSETVTSMLLTNRLGSPVSGMTDVVADPVGEPAGGTKFGRSIADPDMVPSTTGPIVLEMIRGPAAMVIGWVQILSGKAMTAVPFQTLSLV